MDDIDEDNREEVTLSLLVESYSPTHHSASVGGFYFLLCSHVGEWIEIDKLYLWKGHNIILYDHSTVCNKIVSFEFRLWQEKWGSIIIAQVSLP